MPICYRTVDKMGSGTRTVSDTYCHIKACVQTFEISCLPEEAGHTKRTY